MQTINKQCKFDVDRYNLVAVKWFGLVASTFKANPVCYYGERKTDLLILYFNSQSLPHNGSPRPILRSHH